MCVIAALTRRNFIIIKGKNLNERINECLNEWRAEILTLLHFYLNLQQRRIQFVFPICSGTFFNDKFLKKQTKKNNIK